MPKLISLEEIREQPQRTSFNQSYMPVAVMLEGIFPSVFANRPVKDIVEGNPTVTKLSLPTKIAVVADGNIIKNHVRYRADGNHQVMPLGFDRYTKRTFGNKEFVLNLINYMAGQEGIVKLRGRELKMRLLNKDLVKEQKWIWQIVNTILPVILIVLAGILINYRRKRIFGQTQ
jgi:ABC-2 type transport system permease protein